METERVTLCVWLVTGWFARGGGIARTGPYATQVEAYDSMRLASPPTAFPFPLDVVVWPEMVEVREVTKPKSR